MNNYKDTYASKAQDELLTNARFQRKELYHQITRQV